MERYINQVMSRRIETKKLIIQCVRKPAQRNPVGHVESGERPHHRFPAQAVMHVRVVDNVHIVIEAAEGMGVHRVVNRDGRNDQQKAEQN